MNYSLRQLLLVTLLSASMLIWGITAFVIYKKTREEVAELFDAELSQSAKVLQTFVEGWLHGSSLADQLKKEKAEISRWKKDRVDPSLTKSTKKKINLQLSSEEQSLQPHSKNDLKLPATNLNDLIGLTGGASKSPLLQLLDDYLEDLQPTNAPSHKYARKIFFQLWSNNELRLKSRGTPQSRFSEKNDGYSNKVIDGDTWCIFSISEKTEANDYTIHVGQKEEIRSQLSDEISKQLVTLFLIGLPFLGLVIWAIVGQVLKPINRLERQLAKREASYLKPLSTRMMPNEILPVVNEINNLFFQLEQAFEHERRFSADASHELRTPLAGMLTQAQVALKTTDEEVRNQALHRIKQAVNRMTYMVQQLLTFSRIESNTEFLTKGSVFLSHEVVQVITDLEPAAHRKKILLELEEDHEVPVIVNAPLINILIRNVIDNAIKYTPVQGTILVTVAGKERNVLFCVEDSGPGIAPEQYEYSLKRFHRCQETADTTQGSGLGFSIVQRIAAIHGAELLLGTSQFGGLKVTLSFTLPTGKAQKKWQKRLNFLNSKKPN